MQGQKLWGGVGLSWQKCASFLQDIAKRHGDQAVLDALQRPLAAFSVPDCLLEINKVNSLLTAWEDDIQHHWNDAVSYAWTNLKMNVKTTQCKIVL